MSLTKEQKTLLVTAKIAEYLKDAYGVRDVEEDLHLDGAFQFVILDDSGRQYTVSVRP